MPNAERKPEPNDPEQLARLLEIELMQKRAAWQRANGQRNAIRIVAFLFLFAVIAGALFAYYFFFADMAPRAERVEAPKSARP